MSGSFEPPREPHQPAADSPPGGDASAWSAETDELVRLTKSGDQEALQRLFSRHRARLEKMVRFRLDYRMWNRVDVGDVIQDVYMEASRRLESYLKDLRMPFFVWLRTLATQKVIDLHRKHIGAQTRDVRREVATTSAGGAADAVWLTDKLLGAGTPVRAMIDAETSRFVRETIESMGQDDREVLVLRHFEHLSNAEVAQELGIGEAAASKRYARALERLKSMLERVPSVLGETWLGDRANRRRVDG